MFGLSREDRRRLDAAEKVAQEGRDLGNKAAAELAAHTAVCTERHNTINSKLNDLNATLLWVNRQGWLIILGVLGAIALQIALKHGLL